MKAKKVAVAFSFYKITKRGNRQFLIITGNRLCIRIISTAIVLQLYYYVLNIGNVSFLSNLLFSLVFVKYDIILHIDGGYCAHYVDD